MPVYRKQTELSFTATCTCQAEGANIERGDVDEIAFGHAVHFCLGARLAKIEGEVAMGALLQRFPDLAFATPVALAEIEEGVIGVEKLPVRLRA